MWICQKSHRIRKKLRKEKQLLSQQINQFRTVADCRKLKLNYAKRKDVSKKKQPKLPGYKKKKRPQVILTRP